MSSLPAYPFVYHHPHFVRTTAAALSLNDISIQRGYGVFDFLKVVGGRPVFLNDHLERLQASALAMHLQLPLSLSSIAVVIAELLRQNEATDCGLRLIVTGGNGGDGYSIGTPELLISLHHYTSPAAEVFDKGIRLMSHAYKRQFPSVKTTDYRTAIWLQPLLRQRAMDDVLYVDEGWISETPRANIFALLPGGELVTPGEGALAGITRNKLLQCVPPELQPVQRPLHLDELRSALEVFITSTTKMVLPVASVDGILLPQQRACARMLRDRLQQLIEREGHH